MNDELDELQRCGRAYRKLVEQEVNYKIKFFYEYAFHELEIKFVPDRFEHLAGIGKKKIPDINTQDSPEVKYEKASGLYEEKYNENNKSNERLILTLEDIEISDFFFDDTDKTKNESTKDLTEEEFQQKIKSERKANTYVMKSDFLNRLAALENLYSTIEQSGFANAPIPQSRFTLNMYRWDNGSDNSKRPHNSSIAADFLLEFHDGNICVDFYIVEDNKDKGNYHGMSVFQPISSRAFDDLGRKASEVTILSIETLKSGKSISIISADTKTIEQCRQKEIDHNERVTQIILQDPNKQTREKFSSKLGNQRSRFIKKENRLNKENYYKIIESDLFCSEFSEFDLKSLKSGMEQSLNTLNTSEKKRACLEYEIATVETIIELKKMLNELEQLLHQENFSVDDYAEKLSAISAYLADRSVNVGKDLVLKVADLIEQQKESCDEFTAELIDEEVKDMKRTAEQKSDERISFGQSGRFRTAQFHTSMFAAQDNAMSLTMPFEAILNGITDSFNQLQESVIEKIHDFANRLRQTADRIMNTVSATFHKKQEQETEEPSVSAPETENENTEKDSNNNSHYIIMDGAGIQSYGSYFTIVSASELDFQVPLTYEIQQQHEKQQVEQEVSEEKSPAPEHRKKQAEYDDF